MSNYWTPAGCLGPSDIDHARALGMREERCEVCLQIDCECCYHCGVAPFEECKQTCRCTSCEKRNARSNERIAI